MKSPSVVRTPLLLCQHMLLAGALRGKKERHLERYAAHHQFHVIESTNIEIDNVQLVQLLEIMRLEIWTTAVPMKVAALLK